MSELENRLLEYWKADADLWRRRVHVENSREELDEVGLSADAISVPLSSKPPTSRICGYCHQPFMAARPDRKYCSPLCQRQANHALDADRRHDKRVAMGLPVKPRRHRTRSRMTVTGTVSSREFTDTIATRCAKSAKRRATIH